MKKKTKAIGSKPIGNRTIIGIICLVVAIAICFGIAPLVNHITEGKTTIVRVLNPIEKGNKIEEKDIEVVEIGSYNLSPEFLKNKTEIVGKYATTKLLKGDYFTNEKLTEKEGADKNILETLKDGKKAISITIENYALGFSGKLGKGDIISVYYYDNENEKVVNPPELKYVEVVTTTTSQGVDKENNTDGSQPATVTLIVSEKQAELLVKLEQTARMHLTLEFRGKKEIADQFLAEQDKYLKGGN